MATMDKSKAKKCAYRATCSICIIFSIFLIVLGIFLIDGIIRSQAQQGIIMGDQTYGLWGVIPGQTNTFTMRNFTMFRFQNPKQFLYKQNVKPKFIQQNGFLYQQKSQFLNHYYTNNDQLLHFDNYLHFDLLNNSRDPQEKINVVNVGPMGFWMQLQTTPVTSFSIQGMGGLFVQMSQTIKTQAMGQGISSTFLDSYDTFQPMCSQNGIQTQLCKNLWYDQRYGLYSQTNMQIWVRAAYRDQKDTKQLLYKYFYPMTISQFNQLMNDIKQLSQTLDNILSNWYCPGMTNQQCSDYVLTIKQISGSGVTNNPPPGTDPQLSITDSNATLVGYPQIYAYLRKVFVKNYPDMQEFYNLTFSQQSFSYLLRPYQGLLNVGFVTKVYQLGNQYQSTKNWQFIQKLQELLHADSDKHAFVIWKWVNHITDVFALKLDHGGSRKIAGLGAVFSQAWYKVSFAFSQWFLKDVYSFLTMKQIGNNCVQKLSFLSNDKSILICQQLLDGISQQNYLPYYNLIQPCISLNVQQQFMKKYNIKFIEMQQYCDIDSQPSNIGLLVLNIMDKVADNYNCTFNKCTDLQIITKQVFNSQITLNPIKQQGYKYQPSIIAHQWNNKIPTFQYKYYLKLSDQQDVQQHLQSQARKLFSSDKLLNGPQVQQLFILDNDVQFYNRYYWINPTLLRNYIRFVAIQVAFQGFIQSRSAKQIVFGYEDPFLLDLKYSDTMSGGDPSIQSFIAFNDLNITRQQAVQNKMIMYSGYGNASKTRIFHSLNGKQYITFNFSYYDGQKVIAQWISPWAQDVQIVGSDGFSVPPNLNLDDKPQVYIPSVARFSKVVFNRTLKKFDMQLRDMRIIRQFMMNSTQNPDNEKYYQSIQGFLNQSWQGFPLFISKTHFLDADQKWSGRVQIKSIYGDTLTGNQWDDTRIYVQPYTGTAFSATICLQANFFFNPDDILFPSYQRIKQNKKKNITIDQQGTQGDVKRMLPVLNIFRSGNMSQQGVTKAFGQLRMITNNKGKIAGTGWLILSICIVVIIGNEVRNRMDKKDLRQQKKSLLQTAILEQEVQQQKTEAPRNNLKIQKQSLLDSVGTQK